MQSHRRRRATRHMEQTQTTTQQQPPTQAHEQLQEERDHERDPERAPSLPQPLFEPSKSIVREWLSQNKLLLIITLIATLLVVLVVISIFHPFGAAKRGALCKEFVTIIENKSGAIKKDGHNEKTISDISSKARTIRKSKNKKEERYLRRPVGTNILLQQDKSKHCLRVYFPTRGIRGDTVMIAGFAVAWCSFIAVWTAGVIAGGAPICFVLFSIPFWLAGGFLVKTVLDDAFTSSELVISGNGHNVHFLGPNI